MTNQKFDAASFFITQWECMMTAKQLNISEHELIKLMILIAKENPDLFLTKRLEIEIKKRIDGVESFKLKDLDGMPSIIINTKKDIKVDLVQKIGDEFRNKTFEEQIQHLDKFIKDILYCED